MMVTLLNTRIIRKLTINDHTYLHVLYFLSSINFSRSSLIFSIEEFKIEAGQYPLPEGLNGTRKLVESPSGVM